MNERKILIGPYSLGWIKAANISLNHKAFLEYLPAVDFESLIYYSLIQCGANKFEVDPIFENKIPHNKIIRKRFNIAPKKIIKIRNLVYKSFYQFLEIETKKEGLTSLLNFVADLLIAAERKCAIITPTKLPNIQGMRNKLPPELYLPLYNLLNSFQDIATTTPVPKISISSANIERYRELLQSSIYDDYVKKHKHLETNTRITKSALKNLNEVSKNVVNKFNDSLKLRKTSIFLLTTSAKLIETVWGKLPGSIVNLAVKLFSNIEKEKRVVVYQTRNIHKELIRSRIENYVETYISKVEK